jgi:hypothetical protein
MSEKKVKLEKTRLTEGYQPGVKGYQAREGNFDDSNPPQGGSGVPSKVTQGGSGASSVSSSDSEKAGKKD